MPCYHPLKGFRAVGGGVSFSPRGGYVDLPLSVPCGQCIGCRLERSRQWAMRCMHEASLYDANSFVTLTYDDVHLAGPSLNYRDFQLFMKRLRKEIGSARFYMCGEYGEKHWRPHFHACLFGVGFSDRVVFRRLPSGFDVYTSSVLERLWPFGFSSIGDVTFESAAYVARYVVKKVTGPSATEHYCRVDAATGEVVDLVPEFTHMSLKPGIGFEWFRRFRSDVFERDYVVVNGVKCKPPIYYDRCLSVLDPDSSDFMDLVRYKKSFSFASDSSVDRLRARESCTRARLSFSKRSLE